jgi:hypothetical protein
LAEHLNQNQIEDYAGRKLSSAELLSLSDHLVECAECRQQIQKALGGDLNFLALRSEVFGTEPEVVAAEAHMHPTVDRMAAYVDGVLADEELQVVEDHLSGCELCHLAVNDLRAFRDQVAPNLEREYQPALDHIKSESWWHHLAGLLPAPFAKSPMLAFGSAAVLILLVTAGWLVWRNMGEKKPELVLAVPSPTLPPSLTPIPSPTAAPAETAAPLVAELNDGAGRVTLDQAGKLSGVDHLPAGYQRMVQESLASQRLERSALLQGLKRPASSLMGGNDQGNQFSVLEPVGKVVQSDRPTFRWSSLAGATGYVVEVYDEAFNLVANSPQLSANSWTSQPLKRGRIYSWQVKAIKNGQEFRSPRPPASQATFRVLDAATVNELQQARRAYSSSHLVLGLLYARAGLLEEAELEFSTLQKLNPDSALARRLLSQVRNLQR